MPWDEPIDLSALIARWKERRAASPLVWDIRSETDTSCLLIRPFEGDYLLSLHTRGSAERALARRPIRPLDEG